MFVCQPAFRSLYVAIRLLLVKCYDNKMVKLPLTLIILPSIKPLVVNQQQQQKKRFWLLNSMQITCLLVEIHIKLVGALNGNCISHCTCGMGTDQNLNNQPFWTLFFLNLCFFASFLAILCFVVLRVNNHVLQSCSLFTDSPVLLPSKKPLKLNILSIPCRV